MKLTEIINRPQVPQPWIEGEKIPWNEPAFSKRMLKEHLSQTHDAASRRFEIIDQHVNWIHNQVLDKKPTRILDLGCGPGLYTQRLAQLGHTCVGIDFSPASIEYARVQAETAKLDCTYQYGDIRSTEYGSGFGLVMLTYGELNTFHPDDVKTILRKAHAALNPAGKLVLEPHTYDAIVQIGQTPARWDSSTGGLFSIEPHLYLQENFWNETAEVAIQRYFIIDALTGDVTFHSSTMQAYTDERYHRLLKECNFGNVEILPTLGNVSEVSQHWLLGIQAEKR